MSIQEKIEKLNYFKKVIKKEEIERDVIRSRDDYLVLAKQIRELGEKQKLLIDVVESHDTEFEDLKLEVIDYFKSENIEQLENVSAKFKKKNEVSVSKVLAVLGGDIDQLVTMSGITQKNLKDFAGLESNKPIKKELMDCVEETKKEIVDLDILDLITN